MNFYTNILSEDLRDDPIDWVLIIIGRYSMICKKKTADQKSQLHGVKLVLILNCINSATLSVSGVLLVKHVM